MHIRTYLKHRLGFRSSFLALVYLLLISATVLLRHLSTMGPIYFGAYLLQQQLFIAVLVVSPALMIYDTKVVFFGTHSLLNLIVMYQTFRMFFLVLNHLTCCHRLLLLQLYHLAMHSPTNALQQTTPMSSFVAHLTFNSTFDFYKNLNSKCHIKIWLASHSTLILNQTQSIF